MMNVERRMKIGSFGALLSVRRASFSILIRPEEGAC